MYNKLMKIKKIFFAAILIFLGSFSAASAATINVNDSTAEDVDNGVCSIVEAILNSNNNNQSGSTDCVSGNGTDTLVINTDIVFTTFYANGWNNMVATPFITDSLIIDGQGNTFSKSSVDDFRFFHASTVPVRITLKNVTLDGGESMVGGLVYVAAIKSLIISDSNLVNGVSLGEGGAIYAHGLSDGVAIKNTTFEGNSGTIGGAIFLAEADTVMKKVKFIDNDSSSNFGGAIGVSYGLLGISDSAFENNSGVAIYTFGGSGIVANVPMTIVNSTFSGNSSTDGAAAIKNQSTVDLTILNSTFSGNNSSYGPSVISMYDADSKINIGYSTFALNDSDNSEGVIKITFLPTEANIENSIFALNIGGECNVGTLSVNRVNNLSGDGSCGSTVASGINSILSANGGITKTHKILAGSNAIDAALVGPNLKFACPSEDQRHVSRPLDGNGDGVLKCDIGAYESNKVILQAPMVKSISKSLPTLKEIKK